MQIKGKRIGKLYFYHCCETTAQNMKKNKNFRSQLFTAVLNPPWCHHNNTTHSAKYHLIIVLYKIPVFVNIAQPYYIHVFIPSLFSILEFPFLQACSTCTRTATSPNGLSFSHSPACVHEHTHCDSTSWQRCTDPLYP